MAEQDNRSSVWSATHAEAGPDAHSNQASAFQNHTFGSNPAFNNHGQGPTSGFNGFSRNPDMRAGRHLGFYQPGASQSQHFRASGHAHEQHHHLASARDHSGLSVDPFTEMKFREYVHQNPVSFEQNAQHCARILWARITNMGPEDLILQGQRSKPLIQRELQGLFDQANPRQDDRPLSEKDWEKNC
jgi:hypothetical protein